MRARILAISAAILLLLLVSLTACGSPSSAPPVTQPTTRPRAAAAAAGSARREFLFTYEATVTGLRPGQVARVWVPVPPSDEDQQAVIDKWTVPAEHAIGLDPKHLNHVLYARAPAGEDGSVPLSVTYRATRVEVTGDTTKPAPPAPRNPQGLRGNGPNPDADPWLQPDALVPVGGKPLELLQGRTLPDDRVALARVLYDVVNDHMEYRKDKPGWGRGDATWACGSGFGNCSDFHSLFISLARANRIPAKFEIGFPLPPQHGAGDVPGYHCWAKFEPRPGDWVPVDISEAKRHPELRDYYFGHLTADRIVFSTGRDLILEPKQDGPPMNFLIYPYVEVDGKSWPAERVTRRFTFSDVEPKKK